MKRGLLPYIRTGRSVRFRLSEAEEAINGLIKAKGNIESGMPNTFARVDCGLAGIEQGSLEQREPSRLKL